MEHTDNKRIAKNTLFLYLRMLLSTLVSLYTTRIVWSVLGVENYGIYNVVGGIVTMFSFLNSAMIASSQRFISFELGKGSQGDLSKVFSMTIKVHFILAIIILLLSETIGLWFVNCKLNLPETRMLAANIVFQASVLSFLVGVISVPYNALIVAHERMDVYGYLSLLDVVLKLVIVYLLKYVLMDKLVLYSILILGVSVLMRVLANLYCNYKFSDCRYRIQTDKGLLQRIFAFAGWSLIGNMGFSFSAQGLNVMLNMFFNVTLNAAKGMSSAVSSTINSFTSSFQMAVNPQITKLYANGKEQEMIRLVLYGTKYSFFLLFVVALPFFFQCEYVLKLWLGSVSPEMLRFMRLELINLLICSMVSPITTALQATGNIKKFQIIIAIIMLSNLPMAYIWLKLDHDPYIVAYVSIITSSIALLTRAKLLSELTQFKVRQFISKTLGRVSLVTVLMAPIAHILYSCFNQTFVGLIGYCICLLICCAPMIFFVGLTGRERTMCINAIKAKFSR